MKTKKEKKREYYLKNKEKAQRYYIENKEKITQRTKAYFKNNRDKYKEYAAKKYIKHKDRINSKNNEYKEQNRELVNKYQSNYYRQNRGYFNSKIAERRAYKLKATLVGFEAQLYDIYKKCTDLNTNNNLLMVVDHIIPLKHKDVCGLHVPWNLQIIDKSMNLKKKNSFDGTYNNDSWREVT